ncbi:MAG TPA: hypothetical protein VFD02_02245, partial [Syntrophomonadaceae bacterium]|nr:hypothetical protein [Syntrophomonadaceae bacterium]
NLGNQIMTSPFELSVKTQLGGGHSISGILVYLDSDLQVYHKYGDEIRLDSNQSGKLNEPNFSYNVQPVYEYQGVVYELIDIEVEHNGTLQTIGIDDLVGGFLSGGVVASGGKASAKITFIYEMAPEGKITITKSIQNYNSKFREQYFDFLIEGSDGQGWTVRLKHGESKTIGDLKYGSYTISEILPMNYQLLSMTDNGSISLTKENPEKEVVVVNKRSNSGWFYDDDYRRNIFGIRIVTVW